MRWSEWEESSEQVLVAAARAGDLAAFDRLARRYRPAALMVARQLLPAELAEDAAQDALLSAYKALPSLQDLTRFPAWLYAIVRHRAGRLGRANRQALLPLDQVILSYAPAIFEEIADNERLARIRCALASLPPPIREAANLHYTEEWTANQIAGFLDVPLSTIKWRLHSARHQLRQMLALEETNER